MQNTIVVLRRLARNGWVPLRSLSPLFGYKYDTGIYCKQASKNPVTVIKVGGTNRVYTDDVIEALMAVKGTKEHEAQLMIDLFYTIQREQENAESVRTTVRRS